MFYDEIDKDYNPLEDTGSTAYWQNEWDKEKKEAEDEEKRLSEEVELYFKCSNPKCSYVSKTKQKVQLRHVDEIIEQLKKGICPVCGNKGFKQISKEEYEKLEKKNKLDEKKKKKLENQDAKYIKRTLDKVQEELMDIKKDLVSDLEEGKIAPERFAALMINLSFNLYKYYNKDKILKPFWSDFLPIIKDFAHDASKNALETKYSIDELDNTLDLVLREYDDEVKRGDEIYLEYSKKIAEGQAVGKTGEELDEINIDIKDYEYQIKQLEKYNEEQRRLEKIAYSKQDRNAEKSTKKRFFDELRRNSNK